MLSMPLAMANATSGTTGLDVAGSIANYFNEHGWRSSEEVAARASLGSNWQGDVPKPVNSLKVTDTVASLSAQGVLFATDLSADSKAKLLTYENADGMEQLGWLSQLFCYHPLQPQRDVCARRGTSLDRQLPQRSMLMPRKPRVACTGLQFCRPERVWRQQHQGRRPWQWPYNAAAGRRHTAQ